MLLIEHGPKKIVIKERKGLLGPTEVREEHYVYVTKPRKKFLHGEGHIERAVIKKTGLPPLAGYALTHTHEWTMGVEDDQRKSIYLVADRKKDYWKDIEKDASKVRLTIGLAMFALINKHRDKSLLDKFIKDRDREHVTGRALLKIGKKKVHVFKESESFTPTERYVREWVKRHEPNGVIIPSPEEIFENEEVLEKLSYAISNEIYEKYHISVSVKDIKNALKKSYSIANELAELVPHLPENNYKRAFEMIESHPAFQEYIQFLQEFAGIKPKQPEPTIAEKRAQPVERIQTEERTIIRIPAHEIVIEAPREIREAGTAKRVEKLLTELSLLAEYAKGKVGIPFKELELMKKELEIEKHVGEKAFNLLKELQNKPVHLEDHHIDEEIKKMNKEIQNIARRDVLGTALEEINKNFLIWAIKYPEKVRSEIAERTMVLNSVINMIDEILKNPQKYGFIDEEKGKMYIDYDKFASEIHPKIEEMAKLKIRVRKGRR